MMRFGENMELYNEYELISHSKLADCSMFIVDMVYRPMHLHKEMELCYILSGTCRVSTDRQSFTAGAGGVLLFDAGAGHEIWAAGAPARILTLQLSHGFCSRFYPQIRNVRFGCRLLSDCLSEDALHTLQHAMLQAFSEYLLDSPQAMFACMAQIHAIFALLLQGVPYRVLSDTENTTQTRNAERMHRILHYLETHYSEPAQAVERARLLQRQRDPGHGRALRVVAAGMGAAVHRLHMVRRAQRIQLRHDEQLRAGPSGLDIRVEAGDIPRPDERIAHLFKHVLHIRGRLPLAEARLRVPPDIVLRREDLLAVLVNECLIELGLHGVASS